MPNPWTGIGNPYTKQEVVDRLKATRAKGEPIIAAGAGTGISAKFIEKGGGGFDHHLQQRPLPHDGPRQHLRPHGLWRCQRHRHGNRRVRSAPVVKEIPVVCGVHATDPRRRMWHWLGRVKEMGFSGVNNFPTHTIVDGHFRGVLEEPA